jgi:hypothetical protein
MLRSTTPDSERNELPSLPNPFYSESGVVSAVYSIRHFSWQSRPLCRSRSEDVLAWDAPGTVAWSYAGEAGLWASCVKDVPAWDAPGTVAWSYAGEASFGLLVSKMSLHGTPPGRWLGAMRARRALGVLCQRCPCIERHRDGGLEPYGEMVYAALAVAVGQGYNASRTRAGKTTTEG